MARAGTTLLWCMVLAASGGLCGIQQLEGLKGQSLSFPPPHPMPANIARVIWRTRGTHIAEAKPREKKFTVDYLPDFHGRLFLHHTNISLEIRPLELGDTGMYEVVVDTFSDPTNPKTFSYFLTVHDGWPEMATRTGDTGGRSGSTAGPWRVTEPPAGNATTRGDCGGQPPGGGGPVMCGARSRYCVVKGYVVAAVFVPLLMLVATIHVVTRDKAAKTGDEVSAGSEPPGIAAPPGPSLWR